ncbi:MAG: hypothetical protein KatS3mg104_0040 [Phycisphaerae bacterium]|jgi:CMP-N-acetylneuraminic acid synthetase|nr:MAG: hypothetical protein KatS3mg104_0040 [Phycisphaerae bacterium]
MKSQPKVLGVVLARAGSKGLSDKHLRPLLGRPLIEYTFEHAKASCLLTRVVVSSDSVPVLEMAGRYGFSTLVRPSELCTDTASVQDVMLHATREMTRQGFEPDAVVVLYGNVPVRGPGVIDRAIEHWQKTGCDSVRSFCPVGKWHPAWMSRLEQDRVVALHPGSIHRRQDLEPLYLHDGAVVVMSRRSLERGLESPQDPHAMFGVDRRAIYTDIGETIEVDHLRDLYWAEAALRERTI